MIDSTLALVIVLAIMAAVVWPFIKKELVAGSDQEPASAPAPQPAAESGVNPHLYAIIAASVSAVLDEQFEIKEITGVSTDPRFQAWGMEGRRHHFASHRVR